MQDLDEGNGELPHELNAILESIEAKPIGTELEDGEPWSEKDKNQSNVSVLSNLIIFLGISMFLVANSGRRF